MTTVPNMKQIMRWAISAIILFLLAKYISGHSRDFAFLNTLRWPVLTPIVLLTLSSYLLETFRYFLVVRAMGISVPFRDVFRHLIVARFLNKLFPQSGIVYRAHAFKKENAVGYGRFIASFAAFIWLDLVLTMLIATTIVAMYQPGLSANGHPLLPWLSAFSALLLFTTYLSRIIPARPESDYGAGPGRGYSRRALHMFIGQIGSTFDIARSPRLLLSGSLIILANTALSVWRMFFLFHLVGVAVTIPELTLFVGLNRVSNTVVLTPGNLGVVESLYGILSGAIGIGAAEGVTVAVVLRAVAFMMLGCLSAGLFFSQNRRDAGPPPGGNA